MADLSNPDSLLPDEARLTVIREAVADYNAGRPAIAREHAFRYPAIIGASAVLGGGLLLVMWLNGAEEVLLFVILFFPLFYNPVIKFADKTRVDYQLNLRHKLLPVIFGFIDNFSFEFRDHIPFLRAFRNSKLFSFGIGNTRDCITGRHDGKPFELVEAKLETGGKRSRVLFEGVIVQFRREGFFSGTLQARKKVEGLGSVVRNLFGFDADIYECGNPTIDATHEFYTDNPKQAAKLMYEPLAKAIDFLQSNWQAGSVLVGFRNHEVYLMLPTKRDLFELPDINTDVDFSRTILPMLRDMMMLLATMDLVAKVGETD